MEQWPDTNRAAAVRTVGPRLPCVVAVRIHACHVHIPVYLLPSAIIPAGRSASTSVSLRRTSSLPLASSASAPRSIGSAQWRVGNERSECIDCFRTLRVYECMRCESALIVVVGGVHRAQCPVATSCWPACFLLLSSCLAQRLAVITTLTRLPITTSHSHSQTWSRTRIYSGKRTERERKGGSAATMTGHIDNSGDC